MKRFQSDLDKMEKKIVGREEASGMRVSERMPAKRLPRMNQDFKARMGRVKAGKK